MAFLKRIGIFLITNLLVMLVLGFVVSILGLKFQETWGLLIICAIFGMGGSVISLFLSKPLVKASYKVQIVKPGVTHPKIAYLVSAVEAMAAERNLKTPEIGIYNSKDANAFATGASQNSALIAFSSALIDRLSEDELAAVAGHEMSHISNGDMVTMTLLMGVVNTFVMFFARILTVIIDNALRDDRGGGLGYFGYMLVIMVLQNILMLLANIPIAAYSRWREFKADAGSANLVGAAPMIEALKKIAVGYVPEKRTDSYALAKINNQKRISLFATHPPIEVRIQRLQELL
ncbi:MAG: Protease HtpX [Candidatus Cloacimonetes bacterium ADurb.Bin089]|nr:MAG: Protease HtpX [Candidatus Cloacimonetes bacterium ADurb.Bin089]